MYVVRLSDGFELWNAAAPCRVQNAQGYALPLQAGGMYGEPQRPSEFLCLILKMLQIQPDKDIIVEFIKDDAFKYLRLLGEEGRPERRRAGLLPL